MCVCVVSWVGLVAGRDRWLVEVRTRKKGGGRGVLFEFLDHGGDGEVGLPPENTADEANGQRQVSTQPRQLARLVGRRVGQQALHQLRGVARCHGAQLHRQRCLCSSAPGVRPVSTAHDTHDTHHTRHNKRQLRWCVCGVWCVLCVLCVLCVCYVCVMCVSWSEYRCRGRCQGRGPCARWRRRGRTWR